MSVEKIIPFFKGFVPNAVMSIVNGREPNIKANITAWFDTPVIIGIMLIIKNIITLLRALIELKDFIVNLLERTFIKYVIKVIKDKNTRGNHYPYRKKKEN